MRKLHIYAASSTLALAACFAADHASAQTVYGGGSSFAALLYRQIADCVTVPIPGDTLPAVCGAGGTAGSILYASVGSGAGRRAFEHNDGSTDANGFGTTPPATPPAYTTTNPGGSFPYSNFHFGGTDDPMSPTDVATYNANAASKGGAIIQIPTFAGPVAIIYNTTGRGSATLNLTCQALCGIFAGYITQWNDPELTAANPSIGSGQITVVHRHDGSGTTFLTTNALIAQCKNVTGTKSSGSTTIVSYAFPYNVNGGTCPNVTGAAGDTMNWPDVGTVDTCGNAIPQPSGAVYTNATNSAGVAAAVVANTGYIGYVTNDWTLAYNASGGQAANVQNQWGAENPSGGNFIAPTSASASTGISEAFATFDATSVANPLAWSNQGLVPNPVNQVFVSDRWLHLDGNLSVL